MIDRLIKSSISSAVLISCYGFLAVFVLALFLFADRAVFAADAAALKMQGVRISHHGQTGKVRFIGADPKQPVDLPPGARVPQTALEAARAFSAEYGELFGLQNPAQELAFTKEARLPRNREKVRFQQMYKGIPVIAGEIVINLGPGRKLFSMSGEISPGLSVSTAPKVNPREAREIAISAVAKWYGVNSNDLIADQPKRSIYDPRLLKPSAQLPSLVWQLEVRGVSALDIKEFVLVDAQTGAISLHFNQIHHAKDRETYDALGGSALPGSLVCDETDPDCLAGDVDAQNAHRYAGDTYDFYATRHGRDGIDDAGGTIISTVHFDDGITCPNAFWDGTQMVYCDGFADADDVVGHELTHGVTQFESNLLYYYQSGAINESFSDLWGEFVDLTNGSGSDTAADRWLMGEDIPGFGAIRDMQDPTTFGDPDRMSSPNYWFSAGDNGGVHINSGINNKAVYLMTDGDTFNGYSVIGLGIDKVAAIYYDVQTNMLTSGSDYNDLNDALYQACLNLIGGSAGIVTNDCNQVQRATLAVEMDQEPGPGFSTEAAFCPVGETVDTVAYANDMESTTGWTFSTLSGSNSWGYVTGYATSGTISLYSPNIGSTSDAVAYMTTSVIVPTGGYLHFRHAFDFEAPNWDGGVLEYSTNGTTWNDMGSLYVDGQDYNGAVSTGDTNPLAGRNAYVDSSHGYVSSRYDLSSLAGQSVQIRFRIGTDSIIAGPLGWVVDDVQIYSCALSVLMPDNIGVYRPSSSRFYLDSNGNGVWNGAAVDTTYVMGISGDQPIIGDWNGDGIDEIGVYRPGSSRFYLDINGNGKWDGASVDVTYVMGTSGDQPIIGDWNGDGIDEIGVYRPSSSRFYLDSNGNGVWNGAAIDTTYVMGVSGDQPIIGDWNGDGIDEIGVYRPASRRFYLDANGNGVWNGSAIDVTYVMGLVGDQPIIGDWNDDGIDEIGVFRPGSRRFYLDMNGNGVWDGLPADSTSVMGIAGDLPIIGRW